jgi:homopolymeric O-antigen transport system permease protein
VTATSITSVSPSLLSHLSPLGLVRRLWPARGLAYRLTRREVETRYRGSLLGLLWAFVNPLVLLAIYTFVFGVVLAPRFPGGRGERLSGFALALFCGLIPFNVVNECAVRATGLVLGVPNYVKRMVFPLEVLPVSLVGSVLFHGAISTLILLGAAALSTGGLPWTAALAPLVCVPLVFLSLAAAWLLSSLGVFLRDLGQGVALVNQVLLFATPIFYPADALPPALAPLVALNPLAFLVDNLRRTILGAAPPEWTGLAVWSLVSGTAMVFCYAWFMKTKRAFADVL